MTSPIIVKKTNPLMTFPDAMHEVIKGSKVTRQEWNNKNTYGVLKDELLMICINGKFHKWIVSSGDMLQNDWVVINEIKSN